MNLIESVPNPTSNSNSFLAAGVVTMSSLDLLALINAERRDFGEVEVRRNDFTARCEDELSGDHYESFVVKNLNGTDSIVLKLSIDQCMLVAMRESKGVRRNVLTALKARQAPAIPQTLPDALRFAADLAEQKAEAEKQLAVAAPKVEFVNRYVEGSGLRGVREVAKIIGAGQKEFVEWMMDKKIMYRLNGALTAYQNHIDAGRFETKTGVADNDHTYATTKFTAKGVEWVAGEWAKAMAREVMA